MNGTFLGLSLTYWSIPCLMLAITWSLVWPKGRAAGAPWWRRLLIRWGHAATWFALAAATFVAGTGLAGASPTAEGLSLLAAASYLAFLYATITTVSARVESRSE